MQPRRLALRGRPRNEDTRSSQGALDVKTFLERWLRETMTPGDSLVVAKLRQILPTGFTFYESEKVARADDLLIRNRAAGALAEASARLSRLHTEYSRAHLPPPTRENPFPPREHLDRAAAIKRLRDELSALDSTIRGAPVPGEDKVWKRIRSQSTLLTQLMSVDYDLITQCEELRDEVEHIASSDLASPSALDAIAPTLSTIRNTLKMRQMVLQFH